MSVSKVILLYFKNHKLVLVAILLLVVGVALIGLVPAQILRIIVDEIIVSKKEDLLLGVSLCYAVTYLLIGVVTFVKNYVMVSASQSITAVLRGHMMKHVHHMKYSAIVNSDSGTLEAYFNNDVNSLNELFTSGVVNMITDLFKIVGIVVTIFIYSLFFGGIILCIVPVMILFTSFVRKRMLRAQLKTKSLEGNVNKVLLENIENIEQVKVNKAYDYSKSKYNDILNNHFKVNQSSNLYDGMFSPVMQIIRYIVVCTILLISGYNSSFFGMTIGMIISSIGLLTDLFSPIENLGMEIQTIQKSVAAVKRINAFFKTEVDEEKNDSSLQGKEICYQNVSFAYGSNEVIKDFSLRINAGEKIAFQGPSGVGKSTLMKLAMGIIQPTKGRVTIGGVDTYLIPDELRKELFSIVYQDTFFSGGTVYEEITLLDKNISREEVENALKLVGLDYISDLDSTLNKATYSSGELALFNIARVVVKKASVIFLDEMNAKIDPYTGKKIIDLINQISKDKIVISINHYGDILNNAKVISLKEKL